MTGKQRQGSEKWRDVDAVVAAYAGTDAGLPAYLYAAEALRRALDARLWLLCPHDAQADWCNAEGTLVYPTPGRNGIDDGAAIDAQRAIDSLAACRAQAAFVLAEQGAAPYLPAYLCYLAGIPYRAGAEAEFAGAVLLPAVRLPVLCDDVERHLTLLAAVGVVPDDHRSRSARPTKRNRSVECEH